MNFKRFSSTRRMIIAISLLCSGVIIILGSCALAFLGLLWGSILAIVSIVFLALFSIYCLSPLMKHYKRIVIEETLSSYTQDIEYDKSRFNKEFCLQHPLFELKKYYKTDYYFLSNYKGINFEIGNVSTYDELKDHKTYIKVYSFNGKVFSLPIETDEKAKILIIEKKERHTSDKKRLSSTPFVYEIKSKNEQFNELFEIFSTSPDTNLDQFVSFFIETIRKIKKVCAHRVSLLLADNRMYFSIDEQNSSFELKLKNQVTSDDVNQLRKEYSPFFHLMDALLEKK